MVPDCLLNRNATVSLEEKRFMNKFKFLSLGQGQDKAAEAMMTAGASRGHWVLLQNCHLLSSWLPRLSAFLESMKENTCTASTAAAWTASGCAVADTATGTTVTALGDQTAAPNWASCAITCPTNGAAFA